jgi:DnaJ-class molecular chaperone
MLVKQKRQSLEVVCSYCKGSGGDVDMGEFCPCPDCHGTGYVPTKTGRAILDLMRHNLPLMMQQNRRELRS